MARSRIIRPLVVEYAMRRFGITYKCAVRLTIHFRVGAMTDDAAKCVLNDWERKNLVKARNLPARV